jgi:hypothetical protein
MANGVYILANDVVLDQLIALINSIEQNIGKHLPICVVPYDDNTERARTAPKSGRRIRLLWKRGLSAALTALTVWACTAGFAALMGLLIGSST